MSNMSDTDWAEVDNIIDNATVSQLKTFCRRKGIPSNPLAGYSICGGIFGNGELRKEDYRELIYKEFGTSMITGFSKKTITDYADSVGISRSPPSPSPKTQKKDGGNTIINNIHIKGTQKEIQINVGDRNTQNNNGTNEEPLDKIQLLMDSIDKLKLDDFHKKRLALNVEQLKKEVSSPKPKKHLLEIAYKDSKMLAGTAKNGVTFLSNLEIIKIMIATLLGIRL